MKKLLQQAWTYLPAEPDPNLKEDLRPGRRETLESSWDIIDPSPILTSFTGKMLGQTGPRPYNTYP